MRALTTSPATAPMKVSRMRSTEYSGVWAPIARTSMALMGIWFDDPGVSLSAQATSRDTTMIVRTTQLALPKI